MRLPAVGLLRRVPATAAYLTVLAATAGALAVTEPAAALATLHDGSTSLDNLADGHWWVLVTSAALVVPPVPFELAWTGLLLAGSELGLGTRSLALAFATGHVGASLVVAALLGLDVLPGVDASGVGGALDVGPSYGTAASVAALAVAGPGRLPAVRAALVLAAVGAPLLLADRTFTAWGHLVSALLGLGVGTALRRSAA